MQLVGFGRGEAVGEATRWNPHPSLPVGAASALFSEWISTTDESTSNTTAHQFAESLATTPHRPDRLLTVPVQVVPRGQQPGGVGLPERDVVRTYPSEFSKTITAEQARVGVVGG